MSSAERAEAFQLHIADTSYAEIGRKFNVTPFGIQRLGKLDKWEERRRAYARDLTPEEQAELEAIKKSSKGMLLKIQRDIYEMWEKALREGGLKFRSPADMVTAITKIAEIQSKLTDEGDAVNRTVEIVITGTRGQDAIDTTEVKQIEDGSIEDVEFFRSLVTQQPTEAEESRDPLDSFEIGSDLAQSTEEPPPDSPTG